MNGYSISSELGSGGQGRVYKAEYDGKPVAIKQYSREITAQHEYDVICKIDPHPHIIEVYDQFENDKNHYVIMEYIDGGNLFNLLFTKNISLAENDARYYFICIAQGLRHIHLKGYVHRDLKLENIMLKSPPKKSKIQDKIVKIIDFGLCVSNSYAIRDKSPIGSVPYMAPEVQEKKGSDYKSDVWALGVILFELLFGETPFHSEHIYEQTYHTPKTRKLSKEVKHLIRMMLLHNPNERISLDEIFNHPWVKQQSLPFHKLWKKSEIIHHVKQDIRCSLEKTIMNNTFYNLVV